MASLPSFIRHLSLACLLLLLCFNAGSTPPLRDGDIIFQISRSDQSLAIQLATGSPYSHMGIIFHHHGDTYVYEALDIVRYTPLPQWIANGEEGHYVIKRLKQEERLTPAALARLRREAEYWQGRSYDAKFLWSDDLVYCSELVWKAYERALGIQIGTPVAISSLRLDIPEVQRRLAERFGDTMPPPDQLVISPAAMYHSPLLRTVIRH